MMFQPITYLNQICSVPGASLPAAVLAAIQAARDLDSFTVPSEAREVGRLAAAALVNGRDPYTDQAVVAAVVADVIAHNLGEVRRNTWQEALTVAVTHTDAIIDAWRPAFVLAATALEAAVPSIGEWPHESERMADILAQGGDAAAHWVAVKNAIDVIDKIRAAWSAVVEIRGWSSATDLPAIVAEMTYQQWVRLCENSGKREKFAKPGDPLGARKLNAWDVVRAGHHLELATPAQYRDRLTLREPPEYAPAPRRDRVIRTKAENDAMIARISPEARAIAAGQG